jgi:phosphatidate cytidylyltransferase
VKITTGFRKRLITSLVLGAGFWIIFMYLPPFVFSLVLLAILLQIIIFEWRNLFDIHSSLFWLTLPFYPILPFAMLIFLNHHAIYHNLLFILFILVSSHDTGSYIIGTLWGKHTIHPVISPGKTWEGFVGGYIFACIGLTLLLFEQGNLKAWWLITGFAFIVCILALMGDLFESWLKRRAQVKDTGSLLPGHGGFLDRFDGILFAVYFFYLFRNCLMRLF